PDGKVLFQGLPELPATAGQWPAATEKPADSELLCLEGHDALVTGVCFSRDGRQVLSCSNGETYHVGADGRGWFFVRPASTILLWDAQTGKQLACSPIYAPVWNNRAFMRLALAPDGPGVLCARRVASQSSMMQVQLWTTAGGKVQPLIGFPD